MKKNLLGYLRWRDVVAVCIGLALAWRINYAFREPSDYQKWLARPRPGSSGQTAGGPTAGQTGLPPCLFLVPEGVPDQPVISGSIGDCLRPVPDGRTLNLFEIVLGNGFVPLKTDLYVNDVMPLAFTRIVMPLDEWAGRYAVYVPNTYEPFLTGDRRPYTYSDWGLPDRETVHFQRISPGTGFADAVFEAKSDDGIFAGARLAWNGWGWDLSLANGTTLLSPEAYNATRPQQGSLVAIFDQQGREVRLSRQRNGDLAKVDSPNGRWIKFAYENGHMIAASDDSGKTVRYSYDGEGRLASVVYPEGATVRYLYDDGNRIVRVEDSATGTAVQNTYGPNGIVEQTSLDGNTYRIRRLVDDIDVTDPRGTVTRVHMSLTNGQSLYTIEKINHESKAR